MQKLDNKKRREETRGQLERNNHSSKKFIVQVLHLEKNHHIQTGVGIPTTTVMALR